MAMRLCGRRDGRPCNPMHSRLQPYLTMRPCCCRDGRACRESRRAAAAARRRGRARGDNQPLATSTARFGGRRSPRLVPGAQRGGQEPREPAPGGQGGELRHSPGGTLSTRLRLSGGRRAAARAPGWLTIAHHHAAVQQPACGWLAIAPPHRGW
eukprot:scaffold91488_cov36-Phaeocystis_antarctica.AAC.1